MDYRQLNKRKPLGSDAITRIAKEAERGYAQFGEVSPYAKTASAQEVLMQWMESNPALKNSLVSDFSYAGSLEEAAQIMEEIIVGELGMPANADAARELGIDSVQSVDWMSLAAPLFEEEEVDFGNSPTASRRRAQFGEVSPYAKTAQEDSSLYQKLQEAGIETDNHESDLYVKDSPEARAIIEESGDSYTPFTADDGSGRWLDVPFAFDPFWESKGMTASRKRAQEYQGWSNYSTWAVALWISNDQGLYSMVQEAAADSEDAYGLGQYIESVLDEMAPELDGVFADLMRGALSEVNWQEVAQDFLEE